MPNFTVPEGRPGLTVQIIVMRLGVWICLIGLQVSIWATGNFSYLNYLTVVLATLLLSNNYLGNLFPQPTAAVNPAPIYLTIFLYVVGGITTLLQLMNVLMNLFSPTRLFTKIQHALSPLHILNSYGIFAIMTTHRYEIVIEGSQDDKQWKEYIFQFKPSERNRRPRRISPFQPRLDWQAWFLPFTPFENTIWFQFFLIKLLEGEKEVTGLLRYNPFPDTPPRYIRAAIYEYKFTDFKTLKLTGNWWKRSYMGYYAPTIQLKRRNFHH
jgi:lipase maturation factor 1